jgi:NifU-like protein involved in Fe-S cluster formation
VRPIPPVVFEHFRHPRNEGALERPDAIGVVEGRREDSRLRVFLRLAADRRTIETATYEIEGDRTCRVGLSLVTCLARGRSIEEIAVLTPETVGAAYGLHLENLPMLIHPLEAVAAAVSTLRGQTPPSVGDGRVICHCLHVREGRIRRTIRGRALRTVEDVQFWTRACTGCRSCNADVLRILADETQRGSSSH